MLLFVETFLTCEDTSAKCLVGSNEFINFLDVTEMTEPVVELLFSANMP